jgi:hypothetical protein
MAASYHFHPLYAVSYRCWQSASPHPAYGQENDVTQPIIFPATRMTVWP